MEYLTLIFAFPRQKWLRERPSTLGYTYVSCLVFLYRISVNVLFHVSFYFFLVLTAIAEAVSIAAIFEEANLSHRCFNGKITG